MKYFNSLDVAKSKEFNEKFEKDQEKRMKILKNYFKNERPERVISKHYQKPILPQNPQKLGKLKSKSKKSIDPDIIRTQLEILQEDKADKLMDTIRAKTKA